MLGHGPLSTVKVSSTVAMGPCGVVGVGDEASFTTGHLGRAITRVAVRGIYVLETFSG